MSALKIERLPRTADLLKNDTSGKLPPWQKNPE